jgi:hypothetical protein
MKIYRKFPNPTNPSSVIPPDICGVIKEEFKSQIVSLAVAHNVKLDSSDEQGQLYMRTVAQFVLKLLKDNGFLHLSTEIDDYSDFILYLFSDKYYGLPIFTEKCLDGTAQLIERLSKKTESQDGNSSSFDRFLKKLGIPAHLVPALTESEVQSIRSKVPHARNGKNIDLTKILGFPSLADGLRRDLKLLDKDGSLNVQKLQNTLADVMLCQPPSLSTLRSLRNYIDLVMSGQSSPTPVKIKSVTLDGLCRIAKGTSYEELAHLDPDNFAIPNPNVPMTK